ncbi:MAG: hypothetical protein M0010_12995, partial [Actinomycetota bacterium]|nr:hypothetical protein [Actinomycetota bacterium]
MAPREQREQPDHLGPPERGAVGQRARGQAAVGDHPQRLLVAELAPRACEPGLPHGGAGLVGGRAGVLPAVGPPAEHRVGQQRAVGGLARDEEPLEPAQPREVRVRVALGGRGPRAGQGDDREPLEPDAARPDALGVLQGHERGVDVAHRPAARKERLDAARGDGGAPRG